MSVKALGAVGLKGKEKWKYQSELIQSLGGKKPKNRKVPLKILMGMRKKEKKRQAWRDKQIRDSGVVVARPNDLSTSSQKSKKNWPPTKDAGAVFMTTAEAFVTYPLPFILNWGITQGPIGISTGLPRIFRMIWAIPFSSLNGR